MSQEFAAKQESTQSKSMAAADSTPISDVAHAKDAQMTQDSPAAQLYDEYVSMVQSYGYSLDESIDNVNIIGIRGWLDGKCVPNVKNKYNDTIICVWKTEEGGKITKNCEEFIASVDPGSFDEKMNAYGDANLMEGQYGYKMGTHKGYAALNSTTESKVWRDGKKADRTDSAVEQSGYFGINIHAAGDASGNVGNWSAGCQVIASTDGTRGANNTAFKHFRDDILRKDSDLRYTYTLLKGSDFADKDLSALSKENTSYSLNINVVDAIAYDEDNCSDIITDIQVFLGMVYTGKFDKETVMNIARWQLTRGLTADGKFGPKSRSQALSEGMTTNATAPAPSATDTSASSTSGAETTTASTETAPASTQTESSTSGASIEGSDIPDWMYLKVDFAVNAAIQYNRSHNQSIAVQLQRFVHAQDDGIIGKETVTNIAKWQKGTKILDVDGKFGSASKEYARGQGFGSSASAGTTSTGSTTTSNAGAQTTTENTTESASSTGSTAAQVGAEIGGAAAHAISTTARTPYDVAGSTITVNINTSKAIKYCQKTFGNVCSDIQSFLGIPVTGSFDDYTVQKVAVWQQLSGLSDPDGMFGPTSMKTALSQGLKLSVDMTRIQSDYYKLTEESLSKVVPKALNYYSEILYAMSLANITTKAQTAAFIAQITVETDRFNTFTEYGDDNYFAKYNGRSDLGNTEPGDGPRFRGRGAIQLTGRANYTACSEGLGEPKILTEPEILASDLSLAFRSAAWYWTKRDINSKCDNINAVNLAVNGGTNGASERCNYYNEAMKYF